MNNFPVCMRTSVYADHLTIVVLEHKHTRQQRDFSQLFYFIFQMPSILIYTEINAFLFSSCRYKDSPFGPIIPPPLPHYILPYMSYIWWSLSMELKWSLSMELKWSLSMELKCPLSYNSIRNPCIPSRVTSVRYTTYWCMSSVHNEGSSHSSQIINFHLINKPLLALSQINECFTLAQDLSPGHPVALTSYTVFVLSFQLSVGEQWQNLSLNQSPPSPSPIAAWLAQWMDTIYSLAPLTTCRGRHLKAVCSVSVCASQRRYRCVGDFKASKLDITNSKYIFMQKI